MLKVYKYIANTNKTAQGQKIMNTKKLDMGKVIGDFNKLSEDLAKRYKKDAKKIKTCRECFWRKYPEIFNDSSENEVDEGKTRPKKSNLAEIRERLLCKRTAESFKHYQGVMFDSTLSLIQKINFKKRSTTRLGGEFALRHCRENYYKVV